MPAEPIEVPVEVQIGRAVAEHGDDRRGDRVEDPVVQARAVEVGDGGSEVTVVEVE